MSAHLGLRILRQRLFVEHPTPTERIVTSEYTLTNESDNDANDVFLADLPLMLGLEIFDDRGNSLPFLSNREVRTRLKHVLGQVTPSDLQLMNNILDSEEPYFLWITLPNDAIRSGEQKIIKLRYRDKKEASGVPSANARLFTIKRYKIKVQKNPNQNRDLFVNISAPPGFEIKYRVSAHEGKNTLSEGSGLEKSTLDNYIQLRIPVSDEAITADVEYDILPPPLEKRFVTVTLPALYISAVMLLALSVLQISTSTETTLKYFDFVPDSLLDPLLHSSRSVLEKTFEISAGVIAASAAIAGLVRDPLMSRVRLLYFGSASIAAAAFVIHG